MEIFADYGARKLDENEKVAHWATALFGHAEAHVQRKLFVKTPAIAAKRISMNFIEFFLARIIPTGELVALEFKTVANLESACDGIKLKTAICALNHIFTDINK